MCDIAKIYGNKRLKHFVIDSTPPLGEIFFYNREELGEKLKKAGFITTHIIWKGAYEVQVRTRSLAVNPKELLIVAKEFLHFKLPWSFHQMEIEQTSVPKKMLYIPAPKKILKMQPRFIGKSKNRGRITVGIFMNVDGQVVKKIKYRFFIRVYQYILQTKHLLRRHTRLSKKNIQRKNRDNIFKIYTIHKKLSPLRQMDQI